MVRDADLFSRARHSVYAGRELRAWPHATIRRGELVFESGKMLGQPGSGRPIGRGADGAASHARRDAPRRNVSAVAQLKFAAAGRRSAHRRARLVYIGPDRDRPPASPMSASDDENDISRTVPRRGLVRARRRASASLIVVGSGDALDRLRTPRIVADGAADARHRAPAAPDARADAGEPRPRR